MIPEQKIERGGGLRPPPRSEIKPDRYIKFSSMESYNNFDTEAIPNFIITGAMKADTSAFYEYLIQHPDVTKRYPTDLNFFSRNSEFSKGLPQYFSYFSEKLEQNDSSKALIGEASSEYLFSKAAPRRIYEAFPNIKIIILLRNPVDRSIADFYHHLTRVKR